MTITVVVISAVVAAIIASILAGNKYKNIK